MAEQRTAADPQGTVIGLDIGGTSTAGIRAELPAGAGDPAITARAEGGSANLQNVSEQTALESLREVLGRLLAPGLPAGTRLVIGSGGIDTPQDAQALRDLVLRAAPELSAAETPIEIVHDTRLMLAAAGRDTGIVLIAGTGSVAWGRNDDGGQAGGAREARRGGWGHLLGDEGSGWWIGREAVRRALRRDDAAEPVDALDAAVLRASGLQRRQELIADFHGDPDRTAWARLAAQVDACAQQGHGESRQLLEQAAAELLEITAQTARQLGVKGPVVVGGGLTGSAILRAALTEGARDRGLDAPQVLEVPPVLGALHLAQRMPGAR